MTRELLRTGRLAVLLLTASCGRGEASAPVRTLASGLRIVELAPGAGATAEDGSWIELAYDARLAASTANGGSIEPPFDSTGGGEPFLFRLGRSKVLPGLAEGVLGLREGGRRRLTLPPSLAYGSVGKGSIPANAALDYDVRLVRVFTRTASGLQYVEVKHGSGARPGAGQRVSVRCRAWLVETGRSILDARRARNGFDFEVGTGAAIPALEEALPAMNVGSTWRLGVAPELGYGGAGQLPILVAGQDLLLDVELVSIAEKH